VKILRRADLIVFGLLIAHVVIGAARIPGRVYGRRLDHIASYRKLGATRYFLDSKHQHGAASVRWILDNVPEDAVVLWRGDYKGSFEFVPPLIAPRLLVAEGSCPKGAAKHLDRPLASGTLADGRSGVIVLLALGADLELELR
jgi:hypothetical protein